MFLLTAFGGHRPLTVWSQSLDASGAEASQVAALARDWGRSLMVDICLDYFSVRNPFADGATLLSLTDLGCAAH